MNSRERSRAERQVRKFRWEKSFIGETQFGYKHRYRLKCFVEKICPEEFEANQMYLKDNQSRALDLCHEKKFLEGLRHLNCYFGFLLYCRNWFYDNPVLCRVVQEDDGGWIYADYDYLQLPHDLFHFGPLVINGCSLHILHVIPEYDKALVEENYKMMTKLRKGESPETSEQFRELEEAMIVAAYHRWFELEQEFQVLQTNQEHKSQQLSVNTRRAGRAVEFSWEFPQNCNYVLRVYRREWGFAEDKYANTHPDTYVIETASNGKSVQHLEEGKEFFFTCLLTKEEPQYGTESVGDFVRSFVGSPVVKGTARVTEDSLRFSIRIPTEAELSLAEQKKSNPSDERLKNIKSDLVSKVKLEKSLGDIEAFLIQEIKSYGWSAKKRNEAIERLRHRINSNLVEY